MICYHRLWRVSLAFVTENAMYRQVVSSAAIKPPRFEDDSRVASGFGEGQRTKETAYQAARRLARWARAQTLQLLITNQTYDPGFVSIVRAIGYLGLLYIQNSFPSGSLNMA